MKSTPYKYSSVYPRSKWSSLGNSHRCSLNLGSESMLPVSKFKCFRELHKLILIAVKHPESFQSFISYPGILAERQRQVVAGGKWIIHPYSFFSIVWNTLMILIFLAHMSLAPMRLCFVLEKTPYPEIGTLDHCILVLDVICLLDMIIRFNTGFRQGNVYSIVLTRGRIAWYELYLLPIDNTSFLRENLTTIAKPRGKSYNYLSGWFIIDLLSSLPAAWIVLYLRLRHVYIFTPLLLGLLKCARIHTVLVNFKIFMKTFTRSYLLHRCVPMMILFVMVIHWSTCFVFLAPVVYYYVNGHFVTGFAVFLNSRNATIADIDMDTRYVKAMFISFAAFFGAHAHMFVAYRTVEVFLNTVLVLCLSMFMVYILALSLKVFLTLYNSTMRYQELMNQVEKYMRHKQFSAQLRKRVRDFYNYRYQEQYFKEETALECLSEQLRNEINLHTCHKLVNKVALFDGLPASVVGTVLGCLKLEVYMPNDLVVHGGEIGDCMYFIANGTVAVYSLKGAEVCHLEDGAHFGEVALLMKDSKRVATVVAIEITQVYRLDASDFREFIMTYHELYERVEALASKRMHETVLIDEAFRHTRRTTV